MNISDLCDHLRVSLETKHCELPAAEVERMGTSLAALDRLAAPFPVSDLYITVRHHPRSGSYQVKTSLVLTGRTLVAGEEDANHHPAFERCVGTLVQQLEAYQDDLGGTHETSKQEKGTHHDVLPTNAVDTAALDDAVRAGDLAAFRGAIAAYDDPLRRRIGRWVQRFPEVQAHVGNDLAIGDLMEAVYLNAFEAYEHRPANVPLGEWLEGLIDRSLRELLRNPNAVLDNVHLAQSFEEVAPWPR